MRYKRFILVPRLLSMLAAFLLLSGCHNLTHFVEGDSYVPRPVATTQNYNADRIDPAKKEWCRTYLEAYGVIIKDTTSKEKYRECVSERSNLLYSTRTEAGKKCEECIRAWDKYQACKRHQTSNSYGCGYSPTCARGRPRSCPK